MEGEAEGVVEVDEKDFDLWAVRNAFEHLLSSMYCINLANLLFYSGFYLFFNPVCFS